MEVTLSNRDHPEYGSVTIPLPIPTEEYDRCMELLKSIEIGGPVESDCRVEEMTGAPPVLNCLLDRQVNVDELDYLAYRIDGFWEGDEARFSAAAYSLGKTNIRDLINLTFCTDNTTVISDFSPDKLRTLGRTDYLNINGVRGLGHNLDHVDGEKVIRDLIATGTGKVTPYGVYYDNGMEFREVYKGRGFPEDERNYETLCALLIGSDEPQSEDDYVPLHLPAPDSFISRTFVRCGLTQKERIHLHLQEETCPPEVLEAVGKEWTITSGDGVLGELNAMCRAISALSDENRQKLGAIIRFAQPNDTRQIVQLAENLGMFEFVPDVKNPEEYGRYLFRESGIGGDEKMAAFFDFEGYGKEQVRLYDGAFNERGYVALHASITLEELMMDDPSGPEIESVPRERLSAVSPKKGRPHRRPER